MLGTEKPLKKRLYELATEFSTMLSKKCTAPAQNISHVIRLEQAVRQLQWSACKYGAIGPMIFETNLYNLWMMYRNHRARHSATLHKQHPCGFVAQQCLKFLSERLTFTTDRILTMAASSGVDIPQPLACAIYDILVDVRDKCGPMPAKSGEGRQNLLTVMRTLMTVYAKAQEEGKISPKLEAFIRLCSPMLDLNRMFIPIFQHAYGILPSSRAYAIGPTEHRRRTCSFVYLDCLPNGSYALPDCLLIESTEDSLHRINHGNMGKFLQVPENIINSHMLSHVTSPCLAQIFEENIHNPNMSKILATLEGTMGLLRQKGRPYLNWSKHQALYLPSDEPDTEATASHSPATSYAYFQENAQATIELTEDAPDFIPPRKRQRTEQLDQQGEASTTLDYPTSPPTQLSVPYRAAPAPSTSLVNYDQQEIHPRSDPKVSLQSFESAFGTTHSSAPMGQQSKHVHSTYGPCPQTGNSSTIQTQPSEAHAMGRHQLPQHLPGPRCHVSQHPNQQFAYNAQPSHRFGSQHTTNSAQQMHPMANERPQTNPSAFREKTISRLNPHDGRAQQNSQPDPRQNPNSLSVPRPPTSEDSLLQQAIDDIYACLGEESSGHAPPMSCPPAPRTTPGPVMGPVLTGSSHGAQNPESSCNSSEVFTCSDNSMLSMYSDM
ncbi:transcriptional activator [Cricetid gammaherpesvirus 2]|uniref:Transcriptional activator n=1 Tax=Cricetid gammaherpesvirus 2 TaxID=1605972 RepID=E9M5N3_9GAMA|nr:transcriptional activator [Cricetid gammaherpesvirus 2]ADW24391.1 transcriptional activator [Cricetid gammaherpesvirus 2]ADW24473.1 transcriptional activator [Cricetid gammaherpesvirus 2]